MTGSDGASYDFITDRLAVGNVASRAVPGFVAVVTLLTVREQGRPWGPELTEKTPKVLNEVDAATSSAELHGMQLDRIDMGLPRLVPVFVVDIADGEEAYRGSRTADDAPERLIYDRDLDEYLDDVTEFIAHHIRRGCVLVHCGAGVSRSAAIVVAYLCRYAGMSYCEALALVKLRRPQVAPCDAFERAVKRWLRLDDLATTGPRR